MAHDLRGVIPILLTPFTPDGQLDEASLRRLVDAQLAAGVHGLGFALGSEIFKLSEAERDQATTIIVEQVAGRVPVVINTGANGTDLAVHYSRRAEALGADAVMVTPPAFVPPTADETLSYFQAISAAITIPIVIQDTATTPVPPALAARIGETCAQARYIKVEAPPLPDRVGHMVATAGHVLTIIGGAGGNYLIEELRRGSVGTMPSCSQPEDFVAVWNAVQAGDWEGAEATFMQRILPLNRVAAGGFGAFYQVHKTLAQRRGWIASPTVRAPATPLDAMTGSELERLIERLIQPSAAARL
jgi:4-hydroxy-tetrahydrodipicolinate synthase